MLLGQVSIDQCRIFTSDDLFSAARNIAALRQEADVPKPKSKAAAVRSAKAKLEALKKKPPIVVLQRRWSAPTRSASMAHV